MDACSGFNPVGKWFSILIFFFFNFRNLFIILWFHDSFDMVRKVPEASKKSLTSCVFRQIIPFNFSSMNKSLPSIVRKLLFYFTLFEVSFFRKIELCSGTFWQSSFLCTFSVSGSFSGFAIKIIQSLVGRA